LPNPFCCGNPGASIGRSMILNVRCPLNTVIAALLLGCGGKLVGQQGDVAGGTAGPDGGVTAELDGSTHVEGSSSFTCEAACAIVAQGRCNGFSEDSCVSGCNRLHAERPKCASELRTFLECAATTPVTCYPRYLDAIAPSCTAAAKRLGDCFGGVSSSPCAPAFEGGTTGTCPVPGFDFTAPATMLPVVGCTITCDQSDQHWRAECVGPVCNCFHDGMPSCSCVLDGGSCRDHPCCPGT